MARFDRMARWYDRWAPSYDVGSLVEALGPRPDDVVLDVGGGTGRVAAMLEPHARMAVVADPSRGMLEQAARKPSFVRPVRSTVERLPFKDASVARVIMVDALHHVDDQEAAVREMRRVLSDDGIAVVEEFRMDRWWARWILKTMERAWLFGSRFDRADAWRRRFETAGFDVDVRNLSWSDVRFVLRPRLGGVR
jgi:demethylmenaquinone methyltransferase/2-methoxy-6-polyprenyl-1,4-benzoquinol methylase